MINAEIWTCIKCYFFSSHSYDILPHSNPIPTIPTTFTLSTPSHCSWKEWKVRSAEITLQDNCRIVDCSHGIRCHYVDHRLISPCAQDNFFRLWPIKFAFISTLYSGSCHNYTMPKLYNPFRGTCLEGVAKKCCYSFKRRDCIEISIWTMLMCDLVLLWSAGGEVLDLDRTVGSLSFWAYNPSFSCPVQCSHDFLNNPYSYPKTPKENERDNCRESEGSGSPVARRKTELKNSSCAPFLVKHLRPSETNLPKKLSQRPKK